VFGRLLNAGLFVSVPDPAPSKNKFTFISNDMRDVFLIKEEKTSRFTDALLK
jgi:hypothetical protein